MHLAQKQFVYLRERSEERQPVLVHGDNDAVARGRVLSGPVLRDRAGVSVHAVPGRARRTVNFNRDVADSAQAVVNNRDVPGPFTKAGYQFMANALPKADQFFAGERWVLCDAAGNISASSCQQGGIDKVEAHSRSQHPIRERLHRAVANLLPQHDSAPLFAISRTRAKKLNVQSGTQSPILGLFWLASQNTGVDFAKDPGRATASRKRFSPCIMSSRRANVDRYVAPSNQPYMNALLTLQTSVDQAAQMPTPDPATASTTLSNATSAKISVKQVAQGFNIDQETHLEATLQKLLEDPITNAEGLLRALGPAELNGKGQGLVRPVLRRDEQVSLQPRGDCGSFHRGSECAAEAR